MKDSNWTILQAGNLYVFCINNPVMFADPSGQFITKALLFIGGAALLGGGISAGSQQLTTGSVNWRQVSGSAAGAGTFAGLMMIPGAQGLNLGFWGTAAWAGAAGGVSHNVNHLVAGTSTTWQGNVNAFMMSAAFASAGFAVTARTAPSTGNFLRAPARQGGILNIGAGSRPIDGAFNIDPRPGAAGVFRGDVTNLSNIAGGSQRHVIMANPHGFNPLHSEVGRVLQRGGHLNITGGMSNRYFNQVFNMSPQELSRQGFTLVSRGQIATSNPGFTTSGANIRGALYQIILQRN